MKDFFLSIIATILIAREQNAKQKLYNRQISLVDFCQKHKNQSYEMKDLAEGKARLIKENMK